MAAPRVASLHAGREAFAKPAQPLLRLDPGGAPGDRHHGRDPERALLLTAAAAYAALADADLPLPYGSLGENLVLEGVLEGGTVDALQRGTRLRVGDAELEVTLPCPLCARLREVHPRLPRAVRGHRGVYARVLTGGVVRQGDAVDVTARTADDAPRATPSRPRPP